MSKTEQLLTFEHESKLKVRSYVTGFGLSIALTLTAYLLVTNHAASRNVLIAIIVVLAFSQFIAQLIFFLHIGDESKPRWKLGVFCFMVGVVLIIVVGSLWIMNNLNYRMTLPQQLQYMNDQDGL